ncbi:MAG: hypothetical protein V4532_09015, partial [Pseudomonadota bacterium]
PVAEFVVFSIIGLSGLIFGEYLLYILVAQWHMHPFNARVFAVPPVFFFNFFMRKYLLFSQGLFFRK